MPAPDADAETPAGNVPFPAPFPEKKRFSFRETAVRTQGALRGPLPSGAAAGEWAASSSGHPSPLVPPPPLPPLVGTRRAPRSAPGWAAHHPARPQVAHVSACGAPGVVRHLDEMIGR